MNKEIFDAIELLFVHKTKQEIEILREKGETGSVISKMAGLDKCLSSKRPIGTRPIITLSGAIKLLDHLFMDGKAAMYYTEDKQGTYIEFEANDAVYHMYNDGSTVYVAEKEIGARFNKLFAHLSNFFNKNLTITDSLLSLEATKGSLPSEDGDIRALSFLDEFYFACKEDSSANALEVNLGDDTLLEQVKLAFITGNLANNRKIGNRISEYESMASVKEPKTSKKKEENKLWKEIKKGKYLLDYEWGEEQLPFITPLEFLNDYIPDQNFFDLFTKFNVRLEKALKRVKLGEAIAKASDVINVFLTGKPGTGKTVLLHALSAAKGLPIYLVPMTKNTEEDTFEGMAKVIEGNITMIKTMANKCINGGGIMAIEEINLADPGVVMGAIGQVLEFPYTLMEQGYNPVKRHPLAVMCGTFNVGTAGSREINQALSSRFTQSYSIDEPSENEFIERLKVKGHDDKPEMCKWVYKRYRSIIDALNSPEYNCPEYTERLCFRACLGALDEIDEGIEPKTAIKHAIIGKIAEVDREIADQVYRELVEVAVAAPH